MMKLCELTAPGALALVLMLGSVFNIANAQTAAEVQTPAATEGITVWVDSPYVDLHMGPGGG